MLAHITGQIHGLTSLKSGVFVVFHQELYDQQDAKCVMA